MDLEILEMKLSVIVNRHTRFLKQMIKVAGQNRFNDGLMKKTLPMTWKTLPQALDALGFIYDFEQNSWLRLSGIEEEAKTQPNFNAFFFILMERASTYVEGSITVKEDDGQFRYDMRKGRGLIHQDEDEFWEKFESGELYQEKRSSFPLVKDPFKNWNWRKKKKDNERSD